MKTLAKQLAQEKAKRKKADKDKDRWQALAESRANKITVLERSARVNEAQRKAAEMYIACLTDMQGGEVEIDREELNKYLDKRIPACTADDKVIKIKIVDVK